MKTVIAAVAGLIAYAATGIVASAFVAPVGPGSDWIVYVVLTVYAAIWTTAAIIAKSRVLALAGFALTTISMLGYSRSAADLARTIDRNRTMSALKSQGADPGPIAEAWSRGGE